MLSRLLHSVIATIPLIIILLVVGLACELIGTWGGIASLAGVYALFLAMAYRMSGVVQSQSRRRISRPESDDSGDSGHRFADTGAGIAQHAFSDSMSYKVSDDPSGPDFNIDGTSMMGDFDMNGHVFGQTD